MKTMRSCNGSRIHWTLEAGFTLIELLVTMMLSTIIFAGLMTLYMDASSMAYDQNLRASTNLQVQAILQNIGSELRILGNGVPFDQANFQIGETTLTDPTVTEPIQVATTSDKRITFRLNESGHVYLLTQDFDPSGSLEIFLTDVDEVVANDPIYISNSVVSGDDGLYSLVESVNAGAKSITISAADLQLSPGATFGIGSILEVVPLVTFKEADDGSGIIRDSGYGEVLMGQKSKLKLEYLDLNGAPLPTPITNTDVINSMRSIRATVTMDSPKSLSDGSTYTTSAEQIFGIRNLNYVF